MALFMRTAQGVAGIPLLSKPATSHQGYQSVDHTPHNEESASLSTDGSSSRTTDAPHQTTVWQTLIHLVKGYIGVGMLSLPWAFTQVGIPIGFAGVFVMSLWSSYNCFTVVRVKRFIEHQRRHAVDVDDDRASETGSSVTTNTNITYPDVGEWAYGKTFQSYVSACIVTQQLAICTVFVSFIGENVQAFLAELPFDLGIWETHAGVMSMALPLFLSLSFIPSLRGLSPVMAAAAILLLTGLSLLGWVGRETWDDRPTTLPGFSVAQAPLALCAILYSFEGICLILPVESAMEEPRLFKPVFVASMGIVALLLAGFSSACVIAFGSVTNGSITAFLYSKYAADNAALRWLLLTTNTIVSLSVLLTYPLQLFPAVELLGPSCSSCLKRCVKRNEEEDEEEEGENDLSGFDPLPPLPEHDEIAMEDWPNNSDQYQLHYYDPDYQAKELADTLLRAEDLPTKTSDEEVMSIRSLFSSAMSFPNQMMPKMVLPGDSPQLRASLVLLTYGIAVVVPNVQSLISLAGALAGSSSALLIPPVLELAWIRQLEGGDNAAMNDALTSPSRRRSPISSYSTRTVRSRFFWTRIRCYVLLVLGVIFLCIGTYASLMDIVHIYMRKAA